MRLTIERIRTLVLATGVLLIVVLAAFLAIGKWKNPFKGRDIPKRLGIDIQQEANGVTYTQAHGGHTIFKIHASRVVQLRDQHATLHDVLIELYGQNGASVDRIKGDEFEYDQKSEIATADGPVEITLTRPAAAPGSSTAPAARQTSAPAQSGVIHVETSGLVFNQKTGVASTNQRVDFSSAQGKGSAMGATYDSDNGLLVLDRAVEFTTQKGAKPVEVHAERAEFERDAETGHLRGATAEMNGETATAAEALITFRDDGSVERMDVSGGVAISTAAGSRLTAPRGSLDLDEDNQPRHARFEGGVSMESTSNGRKLSGTSPAMELLFNSDGELRHAHLERGVEMHSEEQAQQVENGRTVAVEMSRTWRSPVADVDFRQAGAGHVEPAELRGIGGVVVTGETRRGNEAPAPSRLAADEITGVFGAQSTLTSMTGVGHASIDETTPAGARQTASGDRLVAQFAPPGATGGGKKAGGGVAAQQAAQIQSAELDGHVALLQQPAARLGAKAAPLRATAGRAVYEASGQWLHLTVSPRVEDNGMELTANTLDISQASGDAYAHGNVKATWLDNGEQTASGGRANAVNGVVLGGKGPAHAVAAEAELHHAASGTGGEATFRGGARVWQQDNSITGPVIVIDRQKQTLVAKTTNADQPVIAVLLSARPQSDSGSRQSQEAAPAVVRVRGGDLRYSEAEREAVMRAAPLAAVTAESGGVESTSEQVELFLAPAGAARSAAGSAAPAQVERMNAVGHVVLTSQGRRGTGEKLVYTNRTGEYVLTGTPSAPPRLTDPQRGSVTGAALIFNSRNDSVSIEGGGHQTTTETTAPR